MINWPWKKEKQAPPEVTEKIKEPYLPVGWESVEDVKPRTHTDEFPFKEGQFVPNASEAKTDVGTSDSSRVAAYVAGGGEIVDLSNKPRVDNDGFAPDHELLTPFNRAHVGTKEGIASLLGKSGRR